MPSGMLRFNGLLGIAALMAAGTAAAAWAGKHLFSILGDSASVVVQIVVMLFLLFFLWRDRQLAVLRRADGCETP